MRFLLIFSLLLIGCDMPVEQHKVGHVRCFGVYTGQQIGDWPVAILHYSLSEGRDYTSVYEAQIIPTGAPGQIQRHQKGRRLGYWRVDAVVCTCSPQ